MTEAGEQQPDQGPGGGPGKQLTPAVLAPLHGVQPHQVGGRGAAEDDRGKQGDARPGDGQEQRQSGLHLLLPHVSDSMESASLLKNENTVDTVSSCCTQSPCLYSESLPVL